MNKDANDFVREIFDATRDMGDAEYCEYLEEISGALDDAVSAKREEMSQEE